jgi:signal peptidase I
LQPAAAKSFAVELAEILLLAFVLYVAINFAVQTVHVIGYSMVPTLKNNDYVLATKADLHFTTPTRGDIVILKNPLDSQQDFVKRVIALPGERLKITDGRIYINGQQLSEPYLPNEPWTVQNNWPLGGDESGNVIPAGQYFVMGDNRNHSSDSRIFGAIRVDQIQSRAWIRLLPLDHAGLLAGHPRLAARRPGAAAGVRTVPSLAAH